MHFREVPFNCPISEVGNGLLATPDSKRPVKAGGVILEECKLLRVAYTLTARCFTLFPHHTDITPASQILQNNPLIITVVSVEGLSDWSLTGRNTGVIKAPS